jgi:hypothetical protein
MAITKFIIPALAVAATAAGKPLPPRSQSLANCLSDHLPETSYEEDYYTLYSAIDLLSKASSWWNAWLIFVT